MCQAGSGLILCLKVGTAYLTSHTSAAGMRAVSLAAGCPLLFTGEAHILSRVWVFHRQAIITMVFSEQLDCKR